MIGMTKIDLLNDIQLLILISGFIVFCIWFLRSSFGRNALASSRPRRNNLHPAIPFILILCYFVLSAIAAIASQKIFNLQENSWQSSFAGNIALSISAIIIFIAALLLARQSFARRLKGLGLNPRTILRDFGAALLCYWAILPLMDGTIRLTLFIGKLIKPDFALEKHMELEILSQYAQHLPLLISIFVVTVAIAPLIEELLFRGLLQTAFRSSGCSPWVAVAAASVFFVFFHANLTHWPAIFILSMALGYCYEKTGSLFRPILLHLIFNTLNVLAALYTISPSA
jgi:membrane protease YdiL (CAAX protease family)